MTRPARAPSGATILLRGGTYFDFADPAASVFGIDDIGHGLSHICRFTGQCSRFYSVAEHSVHVSMIVPPQYALEGLLHDAPEAFIGDVAKPLKRLLPDYAAIEERVEAAVFARFGISADLPRVVKHADLAMLFAEQRQAMGNDHVWRDSDVISPADVTLQFWTPEVAKAQFIGRYWRLVRNLSEAAE